MCNTQIDRLYFALGFVIILGFAFACVASGQPVAYLPDQTPDIPAGAAWTFADTPGACFWAGFGTSISLGLFALVVKGIKAAFGAGSSYE